MDKPLLTTDRLMLRPFQLDDAPASHHAESCRC